MNSTALLNNRYQIVTTLGRGGFGETFLAIDTHLPSQRKCVIKQLKPIVISPQIPQWMCDRFEQEAHILETLGQKHSQIPQLFAYFQEDNNFYLVQEWIDGVTLTEKVEQGGVLSPDEVEDILIKLLPVLDYIHSQNIVHRDLKPDNIIYRHSDRMPVLIDFGAVKEAMTNLTHNGNSAYSIAIGTPGYMASEQAAGRPIYSSDLYSLGLTAIYLLTGKTPQYLQTDSHSGEIIWRHEIPHLHSNLAGVIDRTIRFNPRERFKSALEMLQALQPNPYASQMATVAIGGKKKNVSGINPPSHGVSGVKTQSVSMAKLRHTSSSVFNSSHTTTPSSSGFNPFLPLTFLLFAGMVSFFLGYSFFTPTDKLNQDSEAEKVSENAENFDTMPETKMEKITVKEEENKPPENKVNNATVEENNSQNPIESPQNQAQLPQNPENPITNPQQNQPSPMVENPPPESVASPEVVIPSSSPVVIDAPPIPVGNIGLSFTELSQKLGQPNQEIGNGDNVTIIRYDNPSKGAKQVNYFINTANGQVAQVELILSRQTPLNVVTATVNQSVSGGVTAGVQEALRAVIEGDTDLRSFNIGKYQGMIQKRDDRIELRIWDRNFIF